MKTKAQVDPMHIIILFIILAIVAAVVIFAFTKYFGKETGIVGGQIGGLGQDYDSDGLVDTVDPCPCDANIQPPCTTSADTCSSRRGLK